MKYFGENSTSRNVSKNKANRPSNHLLISQENLRCCIHKGSVYYKKEKIIKIGKNKF